MIRWKTRSLPLPSPRAAAPSLLPAILLVFAVLAPSALAAGPPTSGGTGVHCVAPQTQTSISVLVGGINPHELETSWHFEFAEAAAGPWSQGPSGSLGPDAGPSDVNGGISGLQPETTYFVRFFAENAAGSLVVGGEDQSPAAECPTTPLVPRTNGSPQVSEVTPTTAHLHGQVIPDNFQTTWEFQYSTSQTGPWTPASAGGGTILQAEADEEFHNVEGDLTGLAPETTYFVRLFAHNEHGEAVDGRTLGPSRVGSFETGGKPLLSTFATHTFDGESLRLLGSVEPHGADTHYRFQYAPAADFEAGACEWSCADVAESPEVDAGPGEFNEVTSEFPTKIVGQDVPDLQPGQSYRFRILASNPAGDDIGTERALQIPALPTAGPPAPCPNEALRPGPSARLPDCRAYEQVTPVEKNGTLDIGTYGAVLSVAEIAEDGERLAFTAPGTEWGQSPDSKNSSYSFARNSSGWQMTSLTPQPNPSLNSYTPELFSPDLGAVGLELGWDTKGAVSPEVELQTGPPGGPYTSVISAPRNSETKWIAANPDFSTQVISSEDHTLLGTATGTKTGTDLYEYTEGQLRQANVASNGKTIGTAGACLPEGIQGYQETETIHSKTVGSQSLSADGRRLFFYSMAVAGCGAPGDGFHPADLYLREGAAGRTVDIGPYEFLGAGPQGDEALLERTSANTREFALYDVGSETLTTLFTIPSSEGPNRPVVSEDLSDFYFESSQQLTPDAPPLAESSEGLSGGAIQNLYHYDLASRTLTFIGQVAPDTGKGGGYSTTPDGNSLYFASTGVGGVTSTGGPGEPSSGQVEVYRYDAAEDLIQCIACASPFKPRAGLSSDFLFGDATEFDGIPIKHIASADGDYVFFDTTAALVPQDVDGEIPPEVNGKSAEHPELVRSPSSDTYEWRAPGIDDCTHPQGCLALISGGRGGYKTELLGTTASGRDVFFDTHEALAATDDDTGGDIYDARIGGGFPPPPARPVECEGDACSHPVPAPNDPTPTSEQFRGAGNVKPKPVKKPHKKHYKKKHHKRHKQKRSSPSKGRAKQQRGRGR